MIETARLLLRRWRDADAEPFFAMGRDAEVMRFLGPPMSRADCMAVIEGQNALADEIGTCFWAIERRADGAFLGFCGIKPGPAGTPVADEPEIGWRLARAAWGQGYALEAAEASLDHGWATTEWPRVSAITVPANERSWGLMICLGMSRDAAGDFDHPALDLHDPLRRHLTYRITRPC
ncbi:GNAT family N-acetyltransferase [Sphingomonas sp. 3P27F8]|uniref:GNAT family N-acetyltransferase n=1 Tax=Sphingomonas sp. 3P27F8 TaxID=2502213 RepID=UPI0010F7EC78|nr:GNAT family N-acetyltransferase [Sphingomonas sp. 3P27F8]